MHCELLVPGLFPSHEAWPAPGRVPALERLLGRGRRCHHDALSCDAWLMRAFGCEEAPLPAGALTLLADGSDEGAPPGSDPWMRVDPVHLRIGRERLALVPGDALEITRTEAELLVEAINRHLSADMTIYPLHPKRWCARTRLADPPSSASPLELAGADMGALRARGPQAARWQGLLTEIQMLLHAHPVNAAREARGEPTVNSVWCWGAGRLPGAAAGPWRSVTADEPIALGLARLARMTRLPLPAGASAWIEPAGKEGRHLAVLDALRVPLALGDPAAYAQRLEHLEAHWFAALLEALRRGRIGMVTIHAPESGATFETTGPDLRRFWRRVRPLAAYAR